jgi:hypothetical protein
MGKSLFIFMLDHPAVVIAVVTVLAIAFFVTVMSVFSHYVDTFPQDEDSSKEHLTPVG